MYEYSARLVRPIDGVRVVTVQQKGQVKCRDSWEDWGNN